MALGIFESIDWLKKKINRLCCWLGIIEGYTGANYPYLDIAYPDTPPFGTNVQNYNGYFITEDSSPVPFSSAVILPGNVLRLYTTTKAKLIVLANAFSGPNPVYVYDPFGFIVETLESAFDGCTNLNMIYTPALKKVGDVCFRNCTSLTTIYMPQCNVLGPSTGLNNVFFNINSNYIGLTVSSFLLTCNGGLPDDDIQYLINNNNVTIL